MQLYTVHVTTVWQEKSLQIMIAYQPYAIVSENCMPCLPCVIGGSLFATELLKIFISEGASVTWYEPPPEETILDHNLDHKLKTVRLLEGVTDSPLSWNFSFSSDLSFDGLTVTFNGVNVAGVRSSGQAGLANPSDQRYNFSWIATEKFTLIISNVTDGDSGMFTCALNLCQGFSCNSWESTIKVEVVGKFTRDKKKLQQK